MKQYLDNIIASRRFSAVNNLDGIIAKMMDAIIAIICKSALRNQRRKKTSWFLRISILDGDNCQRRKHNSFSSRHLVFSGRSFARVVTANTGFEQQEKNTLKICCSNRSAKPRLRRSNIRFSPSNITRSKERVLRMQKERKYHRTGGISQSSSISKKGEHPRKNISLKGECWSKLDIKSGMWLRSVIGRWHDVSLAPYSVAYPIIFVQLSLSDWCICACMFTLEAHYLPIACD